jgi:hypothetical protein
VFVLVLTISAESEAENDITPDVAVHPLLSLSGKKILYLPKVSVIEFSIVC